MPRIVDHAARRAELAEALWQVVRTQGIHQVSVRTVAALAGTSPSALRHYFATQEELLGFALQSVVARVSERLVPMLPTLRGKRGALHILEQLLPLDDDRREEVEVYLAFNVRAHRDPALRAIRDEAESASRLAVRHALQLLADDDALGAGQDPEALTGQTYPLVDGLALHGTLWPERYPPAHLRRALREHLRLLSQPAEPEECR
jgi:AcrR family transcriptional regulator